MNNELMYKEHILDLWKHPENYGVLKKKTCELRGFNQSCGDDLNIQILLKNKKILDSKFTGKGCALSIASASLLLEKIKDMNSEDILKLNYKDILQILEIEVHPARTKCILLPLETLQKMIKNEELMSEKSINTAKKVKTIKNASKKKLKR